MTLIRRRFLSLAGAALAAPAVVAAVVVADLSEPPGARRGHARRRRRHRLPGAADRRAGVARARPAAGDREPHRRRRHIGIESVAKSPPDGYTVLFSNDNIASAPQILKVNGDYQKDLVPVIFIARQPLVWAVHPAQDQHAGGIRRRDEEEPRQGLRDVGRGLEPALPRRVVPEGGRREARSRAVSGAGQAVNDLIAAHVPIACLGPTSMMPHFENGTLRFLAQSSETRSADPAEHPDVPGSGFQGHGARPVVRRVHAGRHAAGHRRASQRRIREVADRRESPHQMLKAANDPVGGTPEQFATLVRNDSAKYARLAKELGIKGE